MNIQKVTVVGSGLMGRGIAYAASLGGFEVALHDINEEQLKDAIEDIKKYLEQGIKIGIIDKNEKENSLNRITTTTSLQEAAEDADFVIEAVLEVMDLKQEIFRELDSICSEEVIIATNTSTMSPTEIGSSTNRPDKTIAMHFFNPVYKMKLIEIVKGLETSDETYKTACYVAEKMNKETVLVNEMPGFVTSRINQAVGNEAMKILQEGIASAEDIDKAVKLGLNYPMGPLELVDLVGLDTRLRNMQYLHEKLGESFRPAPILEKYVNAGWLGRKSGRGFYNYQD